ncbi:EI24 domain-containing protein [Sphingobium phenoxybenzoativorans]|uniref:EI24 domain-containing protein n=1 Tax=Sphingobium phenoxybenzoativorans TaxID=1592790 RepID=UPI000871C32F|nr:EI24 domain-containing protein [Sphingobium phenoxybenzoativorans]
MIVKALFRALPQIFHPATRAVLAKSLGLTLLIFVALGAAVGFGLRYFFLWMGWSEGGLAGAAAAVVIVVLTAWLLFRAVAMAVLGLFSDAIVIAVEQESYPQAAAGARTLSMAAGMRFALRSVIRTVGWNLLALPLYIALLVTGVGTLALFLALNGHLLGKDLADMVEGRHPELPAIPHGTRWAMGIVSALLFLIPVANLLAPIWSAAMAVHVLHGRRERTA